MTTDTDTTTQDLAFDAEEALQAAYEAINAARGAVSIAFRAIAVQPLIQQPLNTLGAMMDTFDHLTAAALALPDHASVGWFG
jgi:phage-related minor tail protein